jgi:hypothetical protein
VEESEARNQDLAESISHASRPLLRQVEPRTFSYKFQAGSGIFCSARTLTFLKRKHLNFLQNISFYPDYFS